MSYDNKCVNKVVSYIKKGIKRRCISIVGVQLWNNIKMDRRIVFFRVMSLIKTYVYGRCMWIYIYTVYTNTYIKMNKK